MAIELALALILDFSGSMDQKLEDNRSKRDVLVENISALGSSLSPQEHALLVTFGSTKASSACGQSEVKEITLAELPEDVIKRHPRPFAETPLAFAIQKLADETSKGRAISRVLIVTDGADSCGEDPCAALAKLSAARLAAGQRERVRVDILGYDLKAGEQGRFDCKGVDLVSIDLKNHVAKSSRDFADRLASLEHDARAMRPLAQGEASVEITGAPATLRTEANRLPGRGEKPSPVVRWNGAFAARLNSGRYALSLSDAWGSTSLHLDLAPGERRQIAFWSDLRLPKASLSIASPQGALLFEATPQAGQNAGAAIQVAASGEARLAPGPWKLRLKEPAWVAGLQEDDLLLAPAAERKWQGDATKLDWKPAPARGGVALLPDAREPILVVPGVKTVPVPKGVNLKWVQQGTDMIKVK